MKLKIFKGWEVKFSPFSFALLMVLVAGLEPARSLDRGILRQMCFQIHKNKNFLKNAKTGQFRTKSISKCPKIEILTKM